MAKSKGIRLEASVSEQIRKELHELGLKTFKMSDRFRGGIPDIYGTNAIWIETKCIGLIPSGKGGFHPRSRLTGPQKTEMRELEEKGDQCFVAIYWQFGDSRAFTFIPFWEFMRITKWELKTLQELGHIVTKGDSFRLDRFFKDGKYDPGIWWNPTFDGFVNAHPEWFNPDLQWGWTTTDEVEYKRQPFATQEHTHEWGDNQEDVTDFEP